MNRKRFLIRVGFTVIAICGMGVYFGMKEQYFGKTLSAHVTFLIGAVVVVSLLIAASEWYRGWKAK